MRRTSCSGASAIEHQFGNSASVRAQYVGTRAINLPYQVAGERLSDGLCRMLRAFSVRPTGRPALWRGRSTRDRRQQPLQRPATDRRETPGARSRSCMPTTPGAIAWTRFRTAVSSRFLRRGFCRRCPANWGVNMATAITTSATTSTRLTFTNCPSRPAVAGMAALIEGWQVSGTVFWHSGLPFSVLSAPYTANGNGIVQGSGPQFASVVAGVPLYAINPIAGVTQPGTIQWLNPDAFVSAVDPSTGACNGGDSAGALPVRRSRPQQPARPGLHLERSLRHQALPPE